MKRLHRERPIVVARSDSPRDNHEHLEAAHREAPLSRGTVRGTRPALPDCGTRLLASCSREVVADVADLLGDDDKTRRRALRTMGCPERQARL